jgi:hypothetical protein
MMVWPSPDQMFGTAAMCITALTPAMARPTSSGEVTSPTCHSILASPARRSRPRTP